jgi:hypothetical protein
MAISQKLLFILDLSLFWAKTLSQSIFDTRAVGSDLQRQVQVGFRVTSTVLEGIAGKKADADFHCKVVIHRRMSVVTNTVNAMTQIAVNCPTGPGCQCLAPVVAKTY